jgi:hypothetical protein
MLKAIALIKEEKISKSNLSEFKTSLYTAAAILNTSDKRGEIERFFAIQNLKNQVSDLKNQMAALHSTLNGNDRLKKVFSKRLTEVEHKFNSPPGKSRATLEENLNTLHEVLMNAKGPLNEGNQVATSQDNINVMKRIFEDMNKEFQTLQKECARGQEVLEGLENVNFSQIFCTNICNRQFIREPRYTDSTEKAIFEEARNMFPELVTEKIIEAGIQKVDRASFKLNSNDYEHHDKDLHNFLPPGGIPELDYKAKGGKEFLQKLKQYYQKHANTFEQKMNTVQEKTDKIKLRRAEINNQINQERSSLAGSARAGVSTVANIIGLSMNKDSTEVQKLEEEDKELEKQRNAIRNQAAINISGYKSSSPKQPNRAWIDLNEELGKLKTVQSRIDERLRTL